MKIVIDIPDEEYERIQAMDWKNGHRWYSYETIAIHNGTPLPEGHGDLVDYEELKNNAREYGAYAEATLSHIKPKIIIEADKENMG